MKSPLCSTCLKLLLNAFLIVFSGSSIACFAQSKTTKYVYDALGRLTYVEDSQNGNRDYDYDKAGNRMLVSTGTSSDLQSDPTAPARPTNLSTSHIADCAWSARWSAVAGATSYLLTDTNNSTQQLTTNQGSVNCPRGNPSGNRPKSVAACNLTMGCGGAAFF